MPEGPEIRLAADEVAAAVAGQVAVEVFFAFDHLKFFEPVLSGEMVTTVEAHGKAMLTRFANGLNIYSHNQLYGQWMVRSTQGLSANKPSAASGDSQYSEIGPALQRFRYRGAA